MSCFCFLQKGQPAVDLSHITKLIDNRFIVMTYQEAMDVLEKNSDKVFKLAAIKFKQK